MTTLPICVWASRHAPTAEHRMALAAYEIRHTAAYWENCEDLYNDILATADHQPPALVMLIAPSDLYKPVVWRLHQKAPETLVIRPVMTKPFHARRARWKWSGAWKRVEVGKVNNQIVIRQTPWQPEAARQ